MVLRLAAGRLSLELAPEVGGCVSAARLRLDRRDFDLLRPLTTPQGQPPDALRAGMFPMAPFANCIRDNRFVFDGRVCLVRPNMSGVRLNFHGSGWRSAWRVASSDAQSADLILEDGRVDDIYRYAASQRFRVEPDGFSVETELVNLGSVRMPFTFGQHPWFPTHSGAHVRFAASSLWLCDADGRTERHGPIPPDADYATPRAPPSSYCNVCYAGWEGRADIAWPGDGVALSVIADPVFGHLMLHAPADGEPVFCLEPQTAPPCPFDELESSPAVGVHILAPGKGISGSVRFVIDN